jgi:hypothetical protein
MSLFKGTLSNTCLICNAINIEKNDVTVYKCNDCQFMFHKSCVVNITSTDPKNCLLCTIKKKK